MEREELMETLAETLGLTELDRDFIAEKEAEIKVKADELVALFRESGIPLATKVDDQVFVNIGWINMMVQEIAMQGVLGHNVEGVTVAEMLSVTVQAAVSEVDSAT